MGKPSRVRPDILEAATRVFGEKGYERTTLDDIAAEVSLHKSSLYHHISSKEELLFEIHQELNSTLRSAVDSALDLAGADPLARFSALVRTMVLVVAREHAKARVYLREHDSLTGERRAEARAHSVENFTVTRSVLAAAMASGQLRHLSADVVTKLLLGMIHSVADWYNPETAGSPEEIAALVHDLLVEGLATRPADQMLTPAGATPSETPAAS